MPSPEQAQPITATGAQWLGPKERVPADLINRNICPHFVEGGYFFDYFNILCIVFPFAFYCSIELTQYRNGAQHHVMWG